VHVEDDARPELPGARDRVVEVVDLEPSMTPLPTGFAGSPR
jgi:hypothetical protein